jgi:hypothetical protein
MKAQPRLELEVVWSVHGFEQPMQFVHQRRLVLLDDERPQMEAQTSRIVAQP